MAPRRERNPMWRGDAAMPSTKRERARRLFGLSGTCEAEGCTKPAVDRHHIDGDTGNNDRSNIRLLCRRHHMVEDGRLKSLKEHHRKHCESRTEAYRARVARRLELRRAGLSNWQIAEREGVTVARVNLDLQPVTVRRFGLEPVKPPRNFRRCSGEAT